MSDYGMKVSQSGYDVKTATDAQLSFTSKGFLLKTFSQGSASFFIPADFNLHTFTIAHNLGYKPAVIAFGSYITINTHRELIPGNDWAGPRVDSTNAYFDVIGRNIAATMYLYYYIFYDKGMT